MLVEFLLYVKLLIKYLVLYRGVNKVEMVFVFIKFEIW